MTHSVDISDELMLCRFKEGVKFLSREQLYSQKIEALYPDVNYFKTRPFNFYLLDISSCILKLNETTAQTMGFDSLSEAIGKNMHDISDAENAKAIIHTDQSVIRTHQTKIVDDVVIRKDGIHYQFLTVKAPIYSVDNKVSGILGCSTMVSSQSSFSDFIAEMCSLNLLHGPKQSMDDLLCEHIQSQVYLSKREKEVLYHLITGKSARETGDVLNLARRTVEFYLELLKDKLHCKNKSELIQRVLSSQD